MLPLTQQSIIDKHPSDATSVPHIIHNATPASRVEVYSPHGLPGHLAISLPGSHATAANLNSPTDTPPDLVTNTHPMITRSKVIANKVALMASTEDTTEPTSVRQALCQPKWVAAMRKVLDALSRNDTWVLVPHQYHECGGFKMGV